MDLLHRTGKWTVRIFEILWSFIITQAYNIYRYNNRNNNHRKLSAHQFKLAVIEGLTNHQVVVGHIVINGNLMSYRCWSTSTSPMASWIEKST